MISTAHSFIVVGTCKSPLSVNLTVCPSVRPAVWCCVCVIVGVSISSCLALSLPLSFLLFSRSESLILPAFGCVAVWACCCCHHVHEHNLISIVCQTDFVHVVSVMSQVNVDTEHVQLLLIKLQMSPRGTGCDGYG